MRSQGFPDLEAFQLKETEIASCGYLILHPFSLYPPFRLIGPG
jgi:hypothetical protein